MFVYIFFTCSLGTTVGSKMDVFLENYLKTSLFLRDGCILETGNKPCKKQPLSKSRTITCWEQRHIHLLVRFQIQSNSTQDKDKGTSEEEINKPNSPP